MNTQPTYAIDFNGTGCVDYDPNDGDWGQIPRSEGGFVTANMGINFNWFGDIKTSVRINVDGFIYFGSNTNTEWDNISPFIAAADISGANDGHVWYKQVGDRFVVVWEEIYAWQSTPNTGDHNTFQVVLSDDDSAYKQICLCYDEMQVRLETRDILYRRV